MKTSESISAIAAALSKAQAVMEGAKKDATNPHFKSKYADLAAVWDACRKSLTDNGIAVVQMTDTSDKDEVIVETRLCHTSGEWIEGRLAIPVTKADAQGFGSALTYCRRYGLSAAVGIAPEDDDGNAAASAKPTPTPANIEGKTLYESLSPEEADYYRTHANAMRKLFAAGDIDGMVDYVRQEMRPSHEDLLIIWHVLKDDSKLRSAYKAAAAKRPTNAELATQA